MVTGLEQRGNLERGESTGDEELLAGVRAKAVAENRLERDESAGRERAQERNANWRQVIGDNW